MPRSVFITTPVPTWEETANFYGLSKADRKFVAGLVGSASSAGAYRFRSSSTASPHSDTGALFETGRKTRKTKSRARKAA